MSVRTPTFTTSSEIWAESGRATSASAAASAMFRDLAMSPPLSSETSDAQETVERLAASVDLVSRDHIDDAPSLHEVMAVGERRDEAEILLDEDHRETALPQLAHDGAERLHDDRREPSGDLV